MRSAIFCLAALIATQAQAEIIFSDNFESNNLSAWTSQPGQAHHGSIVTDPINPSNHALTFTSLSAAGDIFSQAIATVPNTLYYLSFDYLGLFQPDSSADPSDLGGFIGFSQAPLISPSSQVWLAGTSAIPGASDILIDDGQWHTYTLSFTTDFSSLHLMLTDFSNSAGIPGDAYFDNIRLSTTPPVVPTPATLALLTVGSAVLTLSRRFQSPFYTHPV